MKRRPINHCGHTGYDYTPEDFARMEAEHMALRASFRVENMTPMWFVGNGNKGASEDVIAAERLKVFFYALKRLSKISSPELQFDEVERIDSAYSKYCQSGKAASLDFDPVKELEPALHTPR